MEHFPGQDGKIMREITSTLRPNVRFYTSSQDRGMAAMICIKDSLRSVLRFCRSRCWKRH